MRIGSWVAAAVVTFAAGTALAAPSGEKLPPNLLVGKPWFGEGLWVVRVADGFGFVDGQGRIVVPCHFEDAAAFHEGLAAVKSGGRWGFIDRSGAWIVPARFADVKGWYSQGLAAVQVSANGPWGFVDRKGKLAIAPRFTDVRAFSEHLAAVKLAAAGSWGFVDARGNFVVSAQFKRAGDFVDARAWIHDTYDHFGFIDPHGNLAIQGAYQGGIAFKGGLGAVQAGYWHFIDTAGKRTGSEVGRPKVWDTNGFSEGLAGVKIDLNESTKVAQATPYQSSVEAVYASYHGHHYVRSSGQHSTAPHRFNYAWGYMDRHYNLVIPATYGAAGDFSDGLAAVRKGVNDAGTVRYGFVDKVGRLIVPLRFDDTGDFHDGSFAGKLGTRWHLCTRDGRQTL